MIDFLISAFIGLLAIMFVGLYAYVMGPIQTILLIFVAVAIQSGKA